MGAKLHVWEVTQWLSRLHASHPVVVLDGGSWKREVIKHMVSCFGMQN